MQDKLKKAGKIFLRFFCMWKLMKNRGIISYWKRPTNKEL